MKRFLGYKYSARITYSENNVDKPAFVDFRGFRSVAEKLKKGELEYKVNGVKGIDFDKDFGPVLSSKFIR